MKNPYKKLSSKTAYQNPWVKIREDKIIHPNGQEGVYSVMETTRNVVVIPIDGDYTYLIKQYRYPLQKFSLEACAGGDSTLKENQMLVLAKKELAEEIGFSASQWKELFQWYPDSGFCKRKSHLFVAEKLKPLKKRKKTNKLIEVKKVSFDEFTRLIKKGEIQDAFTIIAYYKLMDYLKSKK